MPRTRDYYAELHVAGIFADAGWNIYFPHRDVGMDFIISKTGPDRFEIVRPVQVKGKYPELRKKDKAAYGYVGRLNQKHHQMILAIPFLPPTSLGQQSVWPICPGRGSNHINVVTAANRLRSKMAGRCRDPSTGNISMAKDLG